MSQIHIDKSGFKEKIIIVMIIAGITITAGLLYWYGEKNDVDASAKQSVAFNMSEKEIIDAQKVAAVAAIPGKTVSGTVKQRPDYVSEMEWQVFRNVTGNQPDSDQRLTNLVNKMLFIKKKQAWRDARENTDQRRQLARQLLDMIPEQLAIEAIDAETANAMKARLTADLKQKD